MSNPGERRFDKWLTGSDSCEPCPHGPIQDKIDCYECCFLAGEETMRERAAEIAKGYESFGEDEWDIGHDAACDAIAAAIRKEHLA